MGKGGRIMDFYSMLYAEKLGGDSSKGNEKLKSLINRSITEATADMFEGLTTIGSFAFNSCTSLVSVEIPNSVTSIGSFAFGRCTSLTSIEISNSATSIEDGTFNNCTSLASIEIPNSVTSIGGSAFYGCTSLTSIEIPSSVTAMGVSIFNGCTNLKSVTVLATTPPTLLLNAFKNTHSSLKIYVPSGSVNAYKAATNWSTYASKIQAIPS